LNYEEYKTNLKRLKLSSIEFMKILNMNEKTPATNWRRQNKIPKVVELFFEMLWKLSEDERVLFIHHKLKEAEK
jgi:hypothetical protein